MKRSIEQQPGFRWIILPLPVWVVVGLAVLLWRLGRWCYETLMASAGAAPTAGHLPRQTTHQGDSDCARLAWLLYSHLNRYRLEQGLPQMIWNEQLEQSALYHAHRMVETDEFAHVLSDGVDLSDRVHRFGYRYRQCAENLAYWMNPLLTIEQLAVEIHQGWVGSPGHHANLIGDCQEVGIGVVRDGHTYYAVQNFGTPLTAFATPFVHFAPRAGRQAARN